MPYSSLEADLPIKEELRDAFFEALEEEIQEHPNGICSLFLLFRMDDTSIYFDDTFALWTGEEEFVRFVAPFVQEGRLVFKCRDGTAWGYWFDGRGNVRRIVFTERLEEGYFFQSGHEPDKADGEPLPSSGQKEERCQREMLPLNMCKG